MTVESLADGVGFAQLLDAIHPGCLPLVRLNFSPKYPEDNLRNLRLVEDALKKLKISQPASFDKMAKGMFQDNIVFLQWLHGYARRN
jgi:microtubule-associated protein, RP/EB family